MIRFIEKVIDKKDNRPHIEEIDTSNVVLIGKDPYVYVWGKQIHGLDPCKMLNLRTREVKSFAWGTKVEVVKECNIEIVREES